MQYIFIKNVYKSLNSYVQDDVYDKFVTPLDSDEYFDSIETVMYYMDEPLADPSCIALYFVDQLAAEQIKVVLSGEGADEFFGGYNIYHEPLSLKHYQKLPKALRKGLAAIAKKMPAMKGRNFIIRGSKYVFCGRQRKTFKDRIDPYYAGRNCIDDL